MNTGQDTTATSCDKRDIGTATCTCETGPSSLDQVIEGPPPLPEETGDEEESLRGSTSNNGGTDNDDDDTAAVDPAWSEICKRAANLDGLSSPLTANLDGSFKFRRNSDPTPKSYDDLEPERTPSPPPRNAKPERLKGILRTPSVSFPGTDGWGGRSKDRAQLIAESRARALAESLQQDSSVSGEEGDPEEESVCLISTEAAQAA